MRKSYYRFKRMFEREKELFRVNEKIIAPEVRVIDDEGTNFGVLATPKALELSRARELDLVEVFPKANPPVAKILDYGQFKYWKEKEARKQRTRQKQVEVKGVRLSLRIGQHDKELRARQATEFLNDGNKVRVEIILKGRERQQGALAETIIRDFVKSLGAGVSIDQNIMKQGGKISIIILGKVASPEAETTLE